MIPLASRIHAGRGRSTLEEITSTQAIKAPPVLVSAISRRWDLIEGGAQVLTRWQLEAVAKRTGMSVTGHHATVPEHTDTTLRALDLDPNEFTEDLRTYHEAFLGHEKPEASTARSALACAAIELAGRGRPEELLSGLDDDTIADLCAIGRGSSGRLKTPPILGAKVHFVEDNLPVCLLDGVPLVLTTQTRPSVHLNRLLAGVLLHMRAEGHLTDSVLLWHLRSARIDPIRCTQLLNISLNEADEQWQNVLTPLPEKKPERTFRGHKRWS